MRKILISALLLTSCSGPTWDDLRAEGEAETKRLAELLHRIDTIEELQQELPKVRKSYFRLAGLILDIRERGAKSALPESREPAEASEQLFAELARLYEMPGCRELIESAQIEAIERLKN